MCGILGVVQQGQYINPGLFSRMLDTLTHRGPDGHGVKSFEDGRVIFGHRRLAIIDLSPLGAQPLCNEDETIWLTFNGEIYNYQELRKQLLESGHRFRSQSDSEVIVHAYEEWGTSCVHRFRGIFAFGLWDDRKKRLFLARDHMGVKPLYYSRYAGRFVFASQPMAILADDAFPKRANATGLRDYFAFGYIPAEHCAFDGMHKLKAGHWAILEDGDLKVHCYWQVSYSPEPVSPADAFARVKERLEEAVNTQLVADVPVGCFLSGGIDSSLLVSMAHEQTRLRTFTIGFEEETSDERIYAREVAQLFNTEHHEEVLKRPHVEQSILGMAEYYDEPFDPNGPMPFMEVARLSRRHGTVVALGGDGADELFYGYLRYDDFDCPAWMPPERPRRWWRKLRNAGLLGPRGLRTGDMERFFAYEGCLDESELGNLFAAEFMSEVKGPASDSLRPYFQQGLPAVTAAQLADTNHYLVDHVLCKVDRGAMASGVEARVPFLDPELVKMAFSIPVETNYKNGERKALLKQVARRYLPKEVVTPRKKGFSSPMHQWVDHRFRVWGNEIISDGSLVRYGIVRADWPQTLAAWEASGRANALRAWWLLLMAEIWHRRWIADEKIDIR